jgi:hypothetical protein
MNEVTTATTANAARTSRENTERGVAHVADRVEDRIRWTHVR